MDVRLSDGGYLVTGGKRRIPASHDGPIRTDPRMGAGRSV